MGKVLCKIHGGQISPTVCRHIAQAVLERKPFSVGAQVIFKDEAASWTYNFCSACAEAHRLPAKLNVPWEALDSAAYKDICDESTLACRLCFNELKVEE